MDFAILADHRGKIKESEKRVKYLDLARKLKMLLNMRVTVILIIIGILGMVPKSLKKGLEVLVIKDNSRPSNYNFIKIGQKNENSSGELRGTCHYSNSNERPSANADMKNS